MSKFIEEPDHCTSCGEEIDDPDDTGNVADERLCSECRDNWPTSDIDELIEDGTVLPSEHPRITVQ